MDPKLEKKLAKHGIVRKDASETGIIMTRKDGSKFRIFPEPGFLEVGIVEKGTIERRDPPKIVSVQNLHLDKDGTNYNLLVFKIVGNFCFGCLGCISGSGYLVIEGLNRRAYLFTEFVPDGQYIAEKLSGGKELSGRDIENVMLLMRIALPGGT